MWALGHFHEKTSLKYESTVPVGVHELFNDLGSSSDATQSRVWCEGL
jgi:hypothetical protein